MRKISIVVDSRTNWTKARSVCEAVSAHDDLTLSLAVCGPMSNLWREYLDGWTPDNVLDTYYGQQGSMLDQSINLLTALRSYLNHTQPDIVIALTDRYETLAIAQAATLMNIHIAHIQGGEVTGNIDESIRHAVTKLSHIHFPATARSAKRIIKMGEDPKYVRTVGCPSIDLLSRVDTTERLVEEPYILFLMHPVTTELEAVYEATRATIEGIRQAWTGKIITIGPNHDAGYQEVWRAIKDEKYAIKNTNLIYSNVTNETFTLLMAHAEVMVGNSSAGIHEAGYFGTPVVDVGIRQQYRERGTNVNRKKPILKSNAHPISMAVDMQLCHGKYEPEQIYGNGQAGMAIADILATIDLPPIQKKIVY